MGRRPTRRLYTHCRKCGQSIYSRRVSICLDCIREGRGYLPSAREILEITAQIRLGWDQEEMNNRAGKVSTVYEIPVVKMSAQRLR